MKIATQIFIAVILLSLLTWWLFFEGGDPLTSSETTLIVGLYLVAALAVRWLWSRFQSRR